MLQALDVVVPTIHRTARGLLRPGSRTRTGLVLLDGAASVAPSVQRIYDELGVYLQSADITVLQMTHALHADLGTRVANLLGAVMFLRSRGAQRLLLVASFGGEAPSREMAANAIFTSLLELLHRRASSLDDLAGAVESVTEMMRTVAEMVADVAYLLAPSRTNDAHPLAKPTIPAIPAILTTRENRDGKLVMLRPPAADAGLGDASSPALALPLNTEDGERQAMAHVSALYTWTTRRLRALDAGEQPRLSPAIGGAVTPPAARRTSETQLAFERALRLLDVRWLEVLAALERRDPERARRVRATMALDQAHPAGRSVAMARGAWRHLDGQARREWTRAFSHALAILAGDQSVRPSPASQLSDA